MNHNKTQKLIYEMMITNTGTHMLDSGGSDGRMWQKNQKKSFQDFKNEGSVSHYVYKDAKDSTDINFTVSIFHYLPTRLELDEVCDEFNSLPCKEWNSDIYGISEDQKEWLEARGFEAGDSWNTYNGESTLSQVLQGTELKQDGGSGDYVLIQLHNGADVRGGYTDAKLFKYKSFQEGIDTLPLVDGEIDEEPVSSVYNGMTLYRYDMEKGETNEPVPVKADSKINLYLADI